MTPGSSPDDVVMLETGHCQPPWYPDWSLALQPGFGSEVRSGGPGFPDVSVHGLWEPLAVLSQQVFGVFLPSS